MSRSMEHHVYFWLKEDRQDAESIATFEAGLAALSQSPNIANSHWAKPAATAERPVTDHSWSYAISFEFTSMAEHDAYQENDPIHDQFITDFKEWWVKVLVMDLA
ncbi:MAG: Dabb family protein [Akkermansiaceae bacterium]